MASLREYLCSKFCPSRMSQAEVRQRSQLPFELRQASHQVSNAVMELQGAAANVHREANAFLALVRAIGEDGKKH